MKKKKENVPVTNATGTIVPNKKKKNPILTKDGKLAPGFRLFLMALPLFVYIFIFAYRPVAGLRYAFYNYKPPKNLTDCDFVGFQHFTNLVTNPAMQKNIVRVVKNTLGMALLGTALNWIPMVFAMFLMEIRHIKYRKLVQIITTIPNFISWVIIYSIAFSLFSSSYGMLNNVLSAINENWQRVNFLGDPSHMWIKMWAWGTWKGLGYGAIVYISTITGIDQELYEAASIDGAGRFQKMRYITLPALIPLYIVLFVMGFANLFSSGVDKLYAFQTSLNRETLETIDLYIFNQGIGSGNFSMSTAVGIVQSIVSLVLLTVANNVSKRFREGQGVF